MSRALLPIRSASFDIPLFLAPAFSQSEAHRSIPSTRRPLSTSPSHCKKGVLLGGRSREKNKKRGVSAIRSTGPRVPTKVYKFPLPQPNLDPARRKEFPTNPDHGLWGFFNEARQPMVQPEEELAFGRSWTYQELTVKSFDDLHRLWYTCMLERNRTMTRKRELRRIHAGWGDYEAEQRLESIKATMSRIRRVLADRQLNWLEARSLLKGRPVSELLADEQLEDFDDDGSFMAEEAPVQTREATGQQEDDLSNRSPGRKTSDQSPVGRTQVTA